MKVRNKNTTVLLTALLGVALPLACFQTGSQFARLVCFLALGALLFWGHTSVAHFFGERSGLTSDDQLAGFAWLFKPTTALLSYPALI